MSKQAQQKVNMVWELKEVLGFGEEYNATLANVVMHCADVFNIMHNLLDLQLATRFNVKSEAISLGALEFMAMMDILRQRELLSYSLDNPFVSLNTTQKEIEEFDLDVDDEEFHDKLWKMDFITYYNDLAHLDVCVGSNTGEARIIKAVPIIPALYNPYYFIISGLDVDSINLSKFTNNTQPLNYAFEAENSKEYVLTDEPAKFIQLYITDSYLTFVLFDKVFVAKFLDADFFKQQKDKLFPQEIIEKYHKNHNSKHIQKEIDYAKRILSPEYINLGLSLVMQSQAYSKANEIVSLKLIRQFNIDLDSLEYDLNEDDEDEVIIIH